MFTIKDGVFSKGVIIYGQWVLRLPGEEAGASLKEKGFPGEEMGSTIEEIGSTGWGFGSGQ
ncbi:MAG: hypothetical protein RDU76_00340 [Candidatus Edwardsbacteria bacterium]|nr:hypothetical protein [Candidatus Edwardsbacteria bacterium]